MNTRLTAHFQESDSPSFLDKELSENGILQDLHDQVVVSPLRYRPTHNVFSG